MFIEVPRDVALPCPDLVEHRHDAREVVLDDSHWHGLEDGPKPLLALAQLRFIGSSLRDVGTRPDVLGHRARRVDDGMTADVDDANRTVGEDDAVIELVALPVADRRGDDFLDAFPVVRMDDVPVPCDGRCGAGVIETHHFEVLSRDGLGVGRDRGDPAPGAAEPLHLDQERLLAPQLLFGGSLIRDVHASPDDVGDPSRRVQHGMTHDGDDANRPIGTEDAMLDLVVRLVDDRRGEELPDTLPVVRMNDVPAPGGGRHGLGGIETHESEHPRRHQPGESGRNLVHPAGRVAEPLRLVQERFVASEIRLDLLPLCDLVPKLLIGPLQLGVSLPHLPFEIAHALLHDSPRAPAGAFAARLANERGGPPHDEALL